MKFVVFGMGSGEASHGYAISNYLIQQNHQIIFALRYEETLPFYPPHPGFTPTVTPTVETLHKLVGSTRPDAVILCNSKSFNENTSFVDRCPWPPIPTFSIDSNWLFESEGPTRCIQWLDRYFVVYPEPLFKLGLRENGGTYTIPPSILSRLKAVGFLPSYQKPDEQVRKTMRNRLGIQPHEKFIFCYISGHGALERDFVLEHLIRTVHTLHRKGRAIKVVACGKLERAQRFLTSCSDWLQLRKALRGLDFYLHLASADLVFQHQGLATLAQAISAQVPVIANSEIFKHYPQPQSDVLEIMPCLHAGLCRFLYKHSPHDEIQQAVETLLYQHDVITRMQNLQKKYYTRGEAEIHAVMTDYLLSNI